MQTTLRQGRDVTVDLVKACAILGVAVIHAATGAYQNQMCIRDSTTTLGVRESLCTRYTLARSQRTVETEHGPVRVKEARGWGVTREKPEYEDVANIAREQGLTLDQVKELLQ